MIDLHPRTVPGLRLPRSVAVLRWALTEGLDIHAMTIDEDVVRQLQEIRDLSVTPCEAAAIVAWHCNSLKHWPQLAVTAGDMSADSWEDAAGVCIDRLPIIVKWRECRAALGSQAWEADHD